MLGQWYENGGCARQTIRFTLEEVVLLEARRGRVGTGQSA
jgi:hypothetical protein